MHVVLLGIRLRLVLSSFPLLVLSEHAHFRVQTRFVGHQFEHVEPAHNQCLAVQDSLDNAQFVVQFLDQCAVEGQQDFLFVVRTDLTHLLAVARHKQLGQHVFLPRLFPKPIVYGYVLVQSTQLLDWHRLDQCVVESVAELFLRVVSMFGFVFVVAVDHRYELNLPDRSDVPLQVYLTNAF